MPSVALAATDCRIIEYQDHFEVVCVGDAKYRLATDQPSAIVPGAKDQTVQDQVSVQNQVAEDQVTAESQVAENDQAIGKMRAARQADVGEAKGALAQKLKLRKSIRDAARASRQSLIAQQR